MDTDESDVVQSDLVYSPIAVTIDFLMITPVPQFSTVVTGEVGKERLFTEFKAKRGKYGVISLTSSGD